MKNIIRTSLSLFIVLILGACNLGGASPNTVTGENSPLRLTVRVDTDSGANTFSQPGDLIIYEYEITNTGTKRLAAPVIVTDDARQVTCPDVTTVGNGDAYLDSGESVTCSASYTVTAADASSGSVINVAKANVGGTDSNQSGVTLKQAVAQVVSPLVLTKTADTQTYGQVGQIVTYTYNITNTGATPLGPAQFVIADNKFSASLNCGPAQTTLAPNQMVTCSFPYTITQADVAAPTLTNSATASGAGQTSPAATTTITNLTSAAATQTANAIQTATVAPSPSNLSPGSTIQHQVAVGEWLIQIGRCYGASFEDVRNANPQIADPDFILPAMVVTIPHIGSVGRIYGPPCITHHTVQSGDTWESIAQRYNADIVVLKKVNPVSLTAGTVLKIPSNSAGAGGVVVGATATSTATATATTTAAAQRITFEAGQTSTSRAGAVAPNQTIPYVIATTPGQTLSINVASSAANELGLGVNGPTGLALKPMDGNLIWTTTITTGGDHYINIASLVGGSTKAYTLTVSLTSPTTGTATSTATGTATATATGTPSTPSQ
ncbi:MAG: LysM peptidoglycan-binding domain-containing protein [Chloroflexota bacterium]|nr:LysM peptidoglycan-binding domain-containing protein [Anaerolineales bacterium]